MGYSESKKKDLRAKNFHKLFENKKHKPDWLEMVKKAHAFAKDAICEGEEPLPDDVKDALIPILNKDDDLRKHQKENRASSKKYKDAFADYIVYEFMLEENKKEKDDDGDAG